MCACVCFQMIAYNLVVRNDLNFPPFIISFFLHSFFSTFFWYLIRMTCTSGPLVYLCCNCCLTLRRIHRPVSCPASAPLPTSCVLALCVLNELARDLRGPCTTRNSYEHRKVTSQSRSSRCQQNELSYCWIAHGERDGER